MSSVILSPDFVNYLMQEALKEAAEAFEAGEVPIGAVIAYHDKIIAKAHNQIELNKDATQHAEMLAIQQASKKVNDWRLSEAVLCATLEPCPMCAGAIRQARLDTVIFALDDPQRGAFGSLFDLSQDTRLGALPRLITGVMSQESQALLKKFFSSVRNLDA